MRTSLNEIKQAEKYLLNQLSTGESLLFEARMLINPLLRVNVRIQEKIYSLIGMYHRKRLKEELEIIHKNLFSNPAKKEFQQSIHQLFKR